MKEALGHIKDIVASKQSQVTDFNFLWAQNVAAGMKHMTEEEKIYFRGSVELLLENPLTELIDLRKIK